MRLLTSGLVTNLVSAVFCERPVARWSRAAARRGVKPRRQVRSWALRTDGEVRGDVFLVRRAERRHPAYNDATAPHSPKIIMMASTPAHRRLGPLGVRPNRADDADDSAGYALGRVNERGSEPRRPRQRRHARGPSTATSRRWPCMPNIGRRRWRALDARGAQKHGARGRLREVACPVFECALPALRRVGARRRRSCKVTTTTARPPASCRPTCCRRPTWPKIPLPEYAVLAA